MFNRVLVVACVCASPLLLGSMVTISAPQVFLILAALPFAGGGTLTLFVILAALALLLSRAGQGAAA